ncbi:hypothetical protein T484DRAFT_1875265 [Baffinella frigidus]|nr:hypothetical protein T484DRAFT_1875265 [Cryptophyta sp. CCMP2293]
MIGVFIAKLVMIGVFIAKLVGDALGTESIYIEHIRLAGLPLLDAKEDYLVGEKASDCLSSRDIQVLSMAKHTLQDIVDLLASCPYKGFPVVTTTEEMLVVGYIRRYILQRLVARAGEDPRVTPETTVSFVAHLRPSGRTPSGGDAEQHTDGAATAGGATTPPAARPAWLDLSQHLDRAPHMVFDTAPFDRLVEMMRGVGLRTAGEGVPFT